jgi:hypothetical protein
MEPGTYNDAFPTQAGSRFVGASAQADECGERYLLSLSLMVISPIEGEKENGG